VQPVSSVSLAAIIGFLLSVFYKRISDMSKEIVHSRYATEENLRNEISKLQQSILKIPEGEASEKVESQVFHTRIEKVEQDLRNLRELLFDNPEASVTIPLMKKDIEALNKENDALRKELDRQSTSTKWFLGILITMSIGLFGLAISILLK